MSTPTITLYGIPNCDTVKKARAWLTAHDADYRFHDFKKQGVPADRLPGWMACVGWEKLLNRQGTTWRKLDATEKALVQDAASASTLMQQQASVIKRPVVEWNGTPSGEVSVGFDAAAWSELVVRHSKPV